MRSILKLSGNYKLPIAWMLMGFLLIPIFITLPGILNVNIGYNHIFKAMSRDGSDRISEQDLAEAYFRRGLNHRISRGRASAGLGRLAMFKQDYSTAIEHFFKAVDQLPPNAVIFYQLGVGWEMIGNHSQALLAWRQARAETLFLAQGERYEEIDELENALDNYRLALEINPEWEPAQKAFIKVLRNSFWRFRNEGDSSRAVAVLAEALDLQANAKDFVVLGDYLFENNDFEKAQYWFERGQAAFPEDALLIQRLGRLALEKQDLGIAEVQLRRAILLDPKLARAYLELSRVLQKQGRLLEAEAITIAAIQANPENPWLFLRLGDVYVALRELAKARQAYQHVLEISPGMDQAALRLQNLESSQE